MRVRLDVLLVERGLVPTREKARALVLAGAVRVGGVCVSKPGTSVDSDDEVALETGPRFVSRGGFKLEGALQDLGVSVAGCRMVDVGASTGGFTDCLLKSGASRVYCVDVGYGQLAWELRTDPRVQVLDRTNIRYLDRLPEEVDGAVIDVSFIGLRLVLGPVARLLTSKGWILTLVKPQFEAGRDRVGKGGVVRDLAVHRQVLVSVAASAREVGLRVEGFSRSHLPGPAGNIEYFMLATKTA